MTDDILNDRSEGFLANADEDVQRAFWCAYLAAGALEALNRLDEVTEQGRPVWEQREARDHLHLTLAAFCMSPVAGLQHDLIYRRWDGFVVEAANGEPQAVRDTYEQADEALAQAEVYWDGAATCGHPLAASHVASLHPFRIRQITRAEREAILEDSPILDREP